jgi:hypothetical protein
MPKAMSASRRILLIDADELVDASSTLFQRMIE